MSMIGKNLYKILSDIYSLQYMSNIAINTLYHISAKLFKEENIQ